jgi:hypothetical protein
MDDAEMEWLQSKDAASCAVWEWYKCDSQKRGDGSVRTLSEQEVDTISRRLGIDSPRFSQISQNLHAVKWISQNVIRGWQKWQGARTPEEDAARKQAEYWKQKALLGKGLENITDVSPKASQSLPKPPLEENRGEQRRENPPVVPQGGRIDPTGDMFDHQKTTKPKIEIQLPANIRTPEVEKLWGDWLAHLKQKHTPPTKKAIEMQMKKLSDLGPDRAVATLTHSITQSYQGLYEPETSQPKNGATIVSMNDELKRVLTRIGTLESTYGDMQTWSQEDRLELKRLRQRKVELQSKLGVLV